jgi:hypothetical protein
MQGRREEIARFCIEMTVRDPSSLADAIISADLQLSVAIYYVGLTSDKREVDAR